MRVKLGISLDALELTAALPLSHPQEKIQNNKISFITTDSRQCEAGDLFIPVKCPLDFIEAYSRQAKSKGAIVISPDISISDFLVADTDKALLTIASYYKTKLTLLKKTIAITGSVGKTTAKEMSKRILSGAYKIHATRENYNNDIGMPISILEADKDTEVLILEMGMNHSGEISLLSRTASPDLALITNVTTAHIGNLGSRENIARAKLEILDGMEKGSLIIPYGEALLTTAKERKTFSVSNSLSDYSVSPQAATENGYIVNLKIDNESIGNVNFKISGYHNLYALSSAIAISNLAGLGSAEIKDGIESISQELLRQKIIKIGKIQVYDDSYSASPEAVIANLKMISEKFKTKSCVLGDMLELGENTKSAHINIGYTAALLGFRKIYAFGNYSSYIAEGASRLGYSKSDCIENEDLSCPEKTAKSILQNYVHDEVILFKGSHSIGVWRIYEKIKELSGERNDT